MHIELTETELNNLQETRSVEELLNNQILLFLSGAEPITATYKLLRDDKNDCSSWIDDWRKGWSGKKTGGMGNKNDCIKKMNKFLVSNPTVTKTDIYAARDLYFKTIELKSPDWTYLQHADYFIEKRVSDKDKGVRQSLLDYVDEFRMSDNMDNLLISQFSPYDDI